MCVSVSLGHKTKFHYIQDEFMQKRKYIHIENMNKRSTHNDNNNKNKGKKYEYISKICMLYYTYINNM